MEIPERYKIIEKVGSGAMGMVFKAWDGLLQREVAVKTVAKELAEDPDDDVHERLVREARAAAGLSHPNIITVYDIQQLSDSTRIIMEFVKGGALSSMIGPGRTLSNDAAVPILGQIASALDYAHSRGIVHRDIKPGNIMIEHGGAVKVVDLGIAKLAGGTALTSKGMAVGTPAYMSPEQVNAEPVDGKADQFSLAIVAYELLTGRMPFTGDSLMALVLQILRTDPPAADAVNSAVPAVAAQVLAKAMAKKPSDRFDNCSSFVRALSQALTGEVVSIAAKPAEFSATALMMAPSSGPREVTSIAVLPFTNMSPDKEAEYFSDGLADEISSALTRLPGLRVTARTSALAFRGTTKTVPEIGQALNVSNLLEGSVRKAANRIRITTQLIRASDSSNVWSERYDRDLTDVFAVQDEISQTIVDKLQLTLIDSNKAPRAGRIAETHTKNVEAYNLFLKGRYDLNKMTMAGLESAKQWYRLAIEMDPSYAVAYDGLANANYLQGLLGFTLPSEVMPEAKKAVERAIELDGDLAEAHATRAVILAIYDWDWVNAEREFKRSLELNPASTVARHLYSFYYLRPTGQLQKAVEHIQQALESDPLSSLFRVHLGYLFYLQRDFGRAIETFRGTLEIDPTFYLAYAMLGPTYAAKGDLNAAIEVYEKARSLDLGGKFVDSLHATAYATAGRTMEAREILDCVETLSRETYVSPVSIAYAHCAMQDKDKAFQLLDVAVNQRDPNIIGLGSNPMFDRIRTDRRYAALMKKVGLEIQP